MRSVIVVLAMLASSSAEARIAGPLSGLLSDLRSAGYSVKITSTCSGKHAPRSYHYRKAADGGCSAVDFRTSKGGYRWLKANWSRGLHQYSNGLIHADLGARRSW